MKLLSAVLLCAVPVAGLAQSVDSFNVESKLRFHADAVYSPWSMAESAAYAGILQGLDTPKEWGQGGGAYGKRLASTIASSGIHSVLAFGLDSTLHQDPRYFRSHDTGFWRRTAHAFRGTILTRTDSGGETLSTWRLGSDYGAAFLSNQWYPDRISPPRLRFCQQSRRRILAGCQTQNSTPKALIRSKSAPGMVAHESAHRRAGERRHRHS
jgi:hypothetical protein